MPTPHNEAKKEDIAKNVILCGDPLRAKFIAENYLEDYRLVNSVRNMFYYTGTYKGKAVTVGSHGMGNPSIGIYSHELYSEYDVDTIIRVGTAGAYKENMHSGDILFALASCSDSNYALQFHLIGNYSPIASYDLLEKGVEIAKEKNYPYHVGNVLSADVFYDEDKDNYKKWAKLGVLGVEMESYALYINAAKFNKKALTILSVSDNFITGEKASTETRQTGFRNMMELALDLVVKNG